MALESSSKSHLNPAVPHFKMPIAIWWLYRYTGYTPLPGTTTHGGHRGHKNTRPPSVESWWSAGQPSSFHLTRCSSTPNRGPSVNRSWSKNTKGRLSCNNTKSYIVLLFSHVGDPCDCSFKLIQLTIGRARFLANVNTTLLEPPTFGIVNFDQYPNENCSWEWNNCDFSNF